MAKGKFEPWRKPNGLTLLKAWARDGLTDEQIAEKMGIRASTLYEWKKKYPEISEALSKNKLIYDAEVEEALHKNTTGYWTEETIIEISKDPDGKKRRTVRKVKKWVPGSSVAQFFWLKNRRPDKWRDKHEVELSGDIGISDALKKARERVKQNEPGTD